MLPATVTSIASAAVVYDSTQGTAGNGNDDGSYNLDSIFACPPILNLSKNSNGPWTVGQTSATYTLSATNTGPMATFGTVAISDTLPSGITVPDGAVTLSGTNAANWTCTAASNVLTCTSTVTVAAGGSTTFTFPVSVTALAIGSPVNYASVSGGGGSPNAPTNPNSSSCTPSNLCASTTTTVTAATPVQPAIELKKYVRNVSTGTAFSDTSTTARPKDIIEYCITYINTGGNAANFKLTDNVPAGMVILPKASPNPLEEVKAPYGTGAAATNIRWSNTSTSVTGISTPAGTNLTNAPSDDVGTLTGTGTGTNNTGLLTLDLSATGLPNGDKGTVCFQTQIP
ncbi:DUF11 domain-containing protein [Deinococcus puniceus]|uniref:Uncharacterized protein n=1 Tax=Deinococcus puniceus TaxID=1182568 RepID=A0A172T6V6_9DEIO|nr:DUF11 domain-containing protein [Deinococcus puniceus]ANE42759.1 hypothetical protein SU48_02160 [Deinococcus puniceus]